jgi:uncharacterized protein
MIERAENVLRSLGFRICRVRHHDTIARLELGPRRNRPRARARRLGNDRPRARAIGYAHVTIDLRGYRLGSLNEALRLRAI